MDNYENETMNEFGKTYFSVPRALSILQSPTPDELIFQKKQGSGPTLDYVSVSTVTRTINKVFGLRWSFEICETKVIESQDHKNNAQGSVVQTLGKLTVPGLGSRMQWGSQSIIGGQQVQESAFKSSASDALKKCATLFLVHLDLADKGPTESLMIGPADLYEEDLPEEFRQKMKEQASQQTPATENQPQQNTTSVQEEPQAVPNTISQPVAQEAPLNEAEQNEEYQDVLKPNLNTQPEVQATTNIEQPTPEPEQAPQEPKTETSPADRWDPEDVKALQEHKKRLGIENEGLNPYVQEFFNNPQMTYSHITPTTIKDFNHFMNGR